MKIANSIKFYHNKKTDYNIMKYIIIDKTMTHTMKNYTASIPTKNHQKKSGQV
jgi:hypothetical protein